MNIDMTPKQRLNKDRGLWIATLFFRYCHRFKVPAISEYRDKLYKRIVGGYKYGF